MGVQMGPLDTLSSHPEHRPRRQRHIGLAPREPRGPASLVWAFFH